MPVHPVPTALAMALALAFGSAEGAPTLSTVVSGRVEITQPGAATTLVRQGTDKAILDWRDFSIGAGETVQFQQPGSGSVALNRVIGSNPSAILGRLTANGNIFLVNPNGVLFGAQSRVDVGSLVASTLAISDSDFLAGRHQFTGATSAGVRVAAGATLTAAERGTIALLGATVGNDGTISARLGTVALAAAGSVTLDFNGDGLTQVTVQPAQLRALVANGGAVIADGGQVIMTAAAMQEVASAVVNHGTLQANALVERNGKLLLDAGSTGTVDVTGSLNASGPHGGDVTLLGRSITLAGGAAIHADGADGKVVLRSVGATSVHGVVTANAGPEGGNGGAIETSGATVDATCLAVSSATTLGTAGSWTLAAQAVTIDAALAATIGRALDTGTGVVVAARRDPVGEVAADIRVEASVRHTGSAPATLALNADANILFSRGAGIAAAGGGRLDIDVNAGAHGTPGAIVMQPGVSIASGGGHIALYGNSDPTAGFAGGTAEYPDGILLDGATLDARSGQGGGSISLRGASTQDLPVDRTASAMAPAGIALTGGASIVAGGAISLTGIGLGAGASGVALHDASIATTAGGRAGHPRARHQRWRRPGQRQRRHGRRSGAARARRRGHWRHRRRALRRRAHWRGRHAGRRRHQRAEP